MNKRDYTYIGLFIIFLGLAVGCSKEASPSPPEAPLLIAPNNGENCNTGTSITPKHSSVEFTWSEGANATSYTLSVTNLETLIEIKRTGLTATSFLLNLNKGIAYKWKVTSISTDFPTESAASPSWRFYLQGDGESNSAPFPASLISPDSGSIIELNNGKYTLEWSGSDPDGDDLKYSLYVDKVDGKQTPPTALTELSTTSYEVELQNNSIYYWRVYSEDSNGNSTFSQIRTFRVQ